MQSRMPTRRCAKGKVPCQQISNFFSIRQSTYSKLVPPNILKYLPTTQKLSCESIQKALKYLPFNSRQDSLKEIIKYSQFQFEQITQLVQQQSEPNNVPNNLQQNYSIQLENQIKQLQTPIRKLLKKDDCTQSVSDYNPEPYKNQDIFLDSKVIDKLEDYLSIQ